MIEDERVAVGPAGLPQVHAGEGRRAAAAAGPEVGADDDVVVGGQVGHARDRDQAQPSAPQVVVLLRLLLLSILFCILYINLHVYMNIYIYIYNSCMPN